MTPRNLAPIGAAAVLVVLSGGLAGCANSLPLPGHGANQTRQQPGPNQPTKTIEIVGNLVPVLQITEGVLEREIARGLPIDGQDMAGVHEIAR